MTRNHHVRNKFSWLLISIILLAGVDSYGQNMFVLTQSNYNAVGGSLANPAILTNTRNYFEVNVAAFHFHLWNDFAYLPSSDINIWQLMTPDPVLPEYGEKQTNFMYYRNRHSKQMSYFTGVMGPSAMMQRGKHAFALITSFRYFTHAANIPWEIPVIGAEGIKHEPLQNINYKDENADISAQGWMELGFSYAYDIYHRFDKQITVGASVKLLWGYAGMTAQVNDLDYIIVDDSTLNFRNLNGQIGYALPLDYDNNDFPDHDPFFKGFGAGLDIGVVFTKRRYIDNKSFDQLCDQRFEDYHYRVGFSLLDIGGVRYKNNAQYHSFDDVSRIWQNFDTISYSDFNQVVGDLSEVFYGDPAASYRKDNFRIGSPMAVSLQFDYHIPKKEAFYIAAYWIQPVRLNKHTLRRPAQIAIVPRYETKNIEVLIPVSLYEYSQFRLGLAARFGFLTIGTDKLGTYLGLGDITGLDFYAAIRFNFGKGTCRNKIPDACENSEFGYSNKQKLMFRKK